MAKKRRKLLHRGMPISTCKRMTELKKPHLLTIIIVINSGKQTNKTIDDVKASGKKWDGEGDFIIVSKYLPMIYNY